VLDDDKAQIAEVLIRYATGIDAKDWPLLRTCWTDEVDIDYGDLGHFTNADEFTALMTQIHDGMGQTYHRISNLVIKVDGDRATARFTWSVRTIAQLHRRCGRSTGAHSSR
jgi:hypothetical protein